MSITTKQGLDEALARGTTHVQCLARNGLATNLVGDLSSGWTSGAIPAAGAVPTAAEICSKATVGALANWVDLEGSDDLYIAGASFGSGNNGSQLFLFDRLAHMGGLSGTVTTSQTVDLDVTGSGSNLAERRGSYSTLILLVEIYTALGTTQQTLTVTYTNAAGSGGQTVDVPLGGASPAATAGRAVLVPLPNGCQSVQSAQLGGSTGAAGNFGFALGRFLVGMSADSSIGGGKLSSFDASSTGFARVPEHACLWEVRIPAHTSNNGWSGLLSLVRG